jgi:NAD(P)-dependent dehydrogenase (short-subunit alcohol dehydrogenase family)
MRTILITGCSSGFGLETARFFLDRDWSVVATMRTPRSDLLPASDRLRVLPLDVTEANSIAAAVGAAGPIDVLVNNAGYGHEGVLEESSMDDLRRQFDANVFGAVAMIKAVLPGMRVRRAGRIVNVTSMGGFITMPGLTYYCGSKLRSKASRRRSTRRSNPSASM